MFQLPAVRLDSTVLRMGSSSGSRGRYIGISQKEIVGLSEKEIYAFLKSVSG